jgi:hypothetical protein
MGHLKDLIDIELIESSVMSLVGDVVIDIELALLLQLMFSFNIIRSCSWLSSEETTSDICWVVSMESFDSFVSRFQNDSSNERIRANTTPKDMRSGIYSHTGVHTRLETRDNCVEQEREHQWTVDRQSHCDTCQWSCRFAVIIDDRCQ